MKYISKTVWILSFVSLLTDFASEMLYPVMPVYLSSIGFSILLIGVLEGCIEAVAGLSKAFFGNWSDAYGRRLPFVQWGYLLSAISKPMLAAFATPYWVLFSRSVDRFGKGIRSAPRDALLAAESTNESKATVFGFHRSMDTVGAMLGPLVALAVLFFYPKNYTLVFLIAFVPGLISVALTRLIKEPINISKNPQGSSISDLWKFRQNASKNYKSITLRLLSFALFNSSDVFLLLNLKNAGASDSTIIGLYIFYNLVFSLLAFPMGKLADKIGMKQVLAAGVLIFSISYLGIATSKTLFLQACFIGLYGVYAACTEGVGKAWIGQNTPKESSGKAFGSFMALQSLVMMLASFITAGIWAAYGPMTALITSAIGAALSAIFILTFQYRGERE